MVWGQRARRGLWYPSATRSAPAAPEAGDREMMSTPADSQPRRRKRQRNSAPGSRPAADTGRPVPRDRPGHLLANSDRAQDPTMVPDDCQGG